MKIISDEFTETFALHYRYFTWFQENDKWETMDKSEFPEEYLPIINSTMSKEPCIHKSLLKLWQKNKKNIDKLTKPEILRDVTKTLQNKWVAETLYNEIDAIESLKTLG